VDLVSRRPIYCGLLLGFSGQEKSARNSKPTCVKILEKLTQLEKLYLSKNKLTDVMGLEKLTRLTFLSLSGNPLTDVKGLEKLTQLEKLHLNDNPDLTKAQVAGLRNLLGGQFYGDTGDPDSEHSYLLLITKLTAQF
jgi:Leucine-rich repeat (LRR) protein